VVVQRLRADDAPQQRPCEPHRKAGLTHMTHHDTTRSAPLP
jgi:hypothetical protein